jgi:2-oxoglutarate-dependent dioxygenase
MLGAMEPTMSNATSTRHADPVPARALSAAEIASYKEEGYLVLRGLLPPAAAEGLRAEVMDIMDRIGLPVTKLKQTSDFLAGSLLEAYVGSAALRRIAEQLLEGAASPYLPFTAVKSPGGGKFSFHQDNQYTRHDGPSINLWTALMPMGEAEGSLQVLPRSHLAGTLASQAQEDGGHRMVTFEPEGWVQPVMAPGDCIAFSRLTVHGSGANRSGRPRVAYAMQYHRNDVKAFFDDRWELLTVRPRFRFDAVDRIAVPDGRKDGH